MTIEEKLEELMPDYPVCEFAYGTPSQIPFSDKVFAICEQDCARYKKSWACPPNAGKIEDNIKRINSYDKFLIFSTVWEVPDSYNIDMCLEAKAQHEVVTGEFRRRLLDFYHLPMESLEENPNPEIYILSAGCQICEVCACPAEPCRHPKERMMTMESHGIVVMQLVNELGMTYTYDGTTIAYFSMVLFHDNMQN